MRWHKDPRPPRSKGWHHTKEAKEKIRQHSIETKSHLYFQTPEAIKKANITKKRKYKDNAPWLTEEAQKKRSESLKLFYKNHPERKEECRQRFIKNVIKTGKHNDGLPKNFIQSEKSIEKIRNTVINNYKNHPEIIEIIRKKRLKQVFPVKDSSIEIKLQNALKNAKIVFVKHYPFYIKNFGTQMDIAIPNKKIAIYCDGDYWHNLPNYIKRDKKANKTLKNHGWIVLRFWEHTINNDVLSCVQNIKEVFESR